MSSDALLFLTVFLASAVECVEAVTIVLAAGITSGWRSALAGVATALVVLAAVVAALGPALTVLPLEALRLVVGVLLLAFGLQWLRKAVLRASGLKPLRNEDAVFERELAEGRGVDGYGFTVSFKGVLLEGLEVALIVVTLGSSRHDVPLAAAAAGVAAVLVAAAGVAVRAPLARVPENTLKFGVGVMLTAFGVFWGAEGAGLDWPGGDAALPVLVACTLGLSMAAVALLRNRRVSAGLGGLPR